jgi:glycosyltransferase involved in cell wall biosynthesis
MRALIIRNAYFHDFGGGERFPVHLATELRKNHVEPVVVSRSPKLLEYSNLQDVAVIKGWWWSKQDWSGKNTLLFPLYLGWQVLLTIWYLQLIVRLRPSVVHPQSKDDFIAATIAARLLRKRVVWTDHADLKYVFQNHTVWYKNPVGKLVYAASRLANSVTLVSNSEQQLIESALGHAVPSNFEVIHNGVLDEKIRPVSRKADVIVFCATSRLVTAKGIGELITAFKDLSTQYANIRLWLVGDGPEQEKFKKLADSHDQIAFTGHSDAPLTYVAACDVFVHPSYHEGFSLSLVEAAMLAKPLIACNVGGNPEIVKDRVTGSLITEKNSQELMDAMEQLIEKPELRKQLGNNARKLFVQDFQFDRLVKERFIPLYEK